MPAPARRGSTCAAACSVSLTISDRIGSTARVGLIAYWGRSGSGRQSRVTNTLSASTGMSSPFRDQRSVPRGLSAVEVPCLGVPAFGLGDLRVVLEVRPADPCGGCHKGIGRVSPPRIACHLLFHLVAFNHHGCHIGCGKPAVEYPPRCLQIGEPPPQANGEGEPRREAPMAVKEGIPPGLVGVVVPLHAEPYGRGECVLSE